MLHLGRCLVDRLCVAFTQLLLRSKMFSGITAFIGQRPRTISDLRFLVPSRGRCLGDLVRVARMRLRSGPRCSPEDGFSFGKEAFNG